MAKVGFSTVGSGISGSCESNSLFLGLWFKGLDLEKSSRYLLTIETSVDESAKKCKEENWSYSEKTAGSEGNKITYAQYIESDEKGNQKGGHRRDVNDATKSSNKSYFGIINQDRSGEFHVDGFCFHIRVFLNYKLYDVKGFAGVLPVIVSPVWNENADLGIYSYGISDGHGGYLPNGDNKINAVPVATGKIKIDIDGACCPSRHELSWSSNPKIQSGPQRDSGATDTDGKPIPEQEGSLRGTWKE